MLLHGLFIFLGDYPSSSVSSNKYHPLRKTKVYIQYIIAGSWFILIFSAYRVAVRLGFVYAPADAIPEEYMARRANDKDRSNLGPGSSGFDDDDLEDLTDEDIVDIDDDLEDLTDEDIVDIDDDLEDLTDEDIVADTEVEEVVAPSSLRSLGEEEVEEDEDEELDEDDVEASLDVILKERLINDDEELIDDEEDVDVDEDKGDGIRKVLPKQPGEFVCQSCFLVKRMSQLADPERGLCRDCV